MKNKYNDIAAATNQAERQQKTIAKRETINTCIGESCNKV